MTADEAAARVREVFPHLHVGVKSGQVFVMDNGAWAYIDADAFDDLNDDDVAYLVKGMLHGRGA